MPNKRKFVGIKVEDSKNIILRNNKLIGCDEGIVVERTENLEASNNQIISSLKDQIKDIAKVILDEIEETRIEDNIKDKIKGSVEEITNQTEKNNFDIPRLKKFTNTLKVLGTGLDYALALKGNIMSFIGIVENLIRSFPLK